LYLYFAEQDSIYFQVFSLVIAYVSNLEQARPLLEKQAIQQLVDPCLRSRYLEHEVYRMLHCASLCIRRDPHSRPRMSQVGDSEFIFVLFYKYTNHYMSLGLHVDEPCKIATELCRTFDSCRCHI
jgi:hypothetical protein